MTESTAEQEEKNGIFVEKLEFEYQPEAQEGMESKPFNLSIEKVGIPLGKMTAILGESGKGKSTFLDLLSFVVDRNSPNCNIKESDITYYFQGGNNKKYHELEENSRYLNETVKLQKFGYMFQSSYFLPEISLEDNIGISLMTDLDHPASGTIQEKISGYYDHVIENPLLAGVNKPGKALAGQCSGGQRQRFSLFRALAHQPEILFLDEPTGDLDPKSSRLTFQTLKDLQSSSPKPLTIVLVTHNVELASEFADKIYYTSPDSKISAEHGFFKKEEDWYDNDEQDKKVNLNDIIKAIYSNEDDSASATTGFDPDGEASDEASEPQADFKKFQWWYMGIEYRYADKQARWQTWRSKLTLLFLFIAAFILFGFFNGFQNQLKEQLDNEYVNSIPLNLLYIDDNTPFDTSIVKQSFPRVNIKYFRYPGKTRLQQVQGVNEIGLYGLILQSNHPYGMDNDDQNTFSYINSAVAGADYGLVVSRVGLRKLGIKDVEKLDSLKFDFFNGFEVNQYLPVFGIKENLPNNKDFLVYENFAARYTTETFSVTEQRFIDWKIKVFDQNEDFQLAWSMTDKIVNYMANQGHSVFVDFYGDNFFDSASLVFDGEKIGFSLEEVQSFFADPNKLEAFDLPGQIQVIEKEAQKTVTFEEDIIYLSCTATFPEEAKDQVYAFKSSVEETFPGINVDTQAIETVDQLAEIGKTNRRIFILILLVIGVCYLVINLKTLQLNIQKRKNHIGYLKTIGIPRRVFMAIYAAQGSLETVVFIVISSLVAGLLNFFFEVHTFSFQINAFVVLFSVVILSSLIGVYMFSIKGILNKTFRQIIDGN